MNHSTTLEIDIRVCKKKKRFVVQEKIYLEELTNKAKLIEANCVS